MQQERKLPPYLCLGDRIALVAPARFASADLIHKAAESISEAGFEPVIYEGLDSRINQFGGTDEHRAGLLNRAFRDKSVRAVLALRGGYGTGRLLPLLDTEAFTSDPKWIIGFSDITALHAWANNLCVASIHAPVASTLSTTEAEDVASLWSILKGKKIEPLVQGTIVGGNLSVLYSLMGTPYFPDLTGCTLLLEDLDEFLYHIDRMMLALRLSGSFDKASGLILGEFSDLKDNTKEHGQRIDNPFGRSIDQILTDHLPESFSVIKNAPSGHGVRNFPVVLGGPRG